MRGFFLGLVNRYLDTFAVMSSQPELARRELRLISGSLEYAFDAYHAEGKTAFRSALVAFWDHAGELQPFAVYRTTRASSRAQLSPARLLLRLPAGIVILLLFTALLVLTLVFALLVVLWPDRDGRRATAAAFKQQWKQQLAISSSAAPLLSSVALAIGVGWIVGKSDNPTALSHVFVGAPLMGLWQMGVFRTGWTLEDERMQGTLDLMLTSLTPVYVVVLAKTLAIMASQAVSAAIVLLILIAFAGDVLELGDFGVLLISGLLAIGGVIACSFVFSPFLFLVGGRAGFFNAIMPLGTVLSGFLYPIGLLPPGLEALARLLPTSWAMEAVVRTTRGQSFDWDIAADWLAAGTLICSYLLLAAICFRKAEDRVRVTGGLGTF